MVRGRSECFERDGVSVFVSREEMNRTYVKEGKVKVKDGEVGRISFISTVGVYM